MTTHKCGTFNDILHGIYLSRCIRLVYNIHSEIGVHTPYVRYTYSRMLCTSTFVGNIKTKFDGKADIVAFSAHVEKLIARIGKLKKERI